MSDEPEREDARTAGEPGVCSWNEWDPLREVIVGLRRGVVRALRARHLLAAELRSYFLSLDGV